MKNLSVNGEISSSVVKIVLESPPIRFHPRRSSISSSVIGLPNKIANVSSVKNAKYPSPGVNVSTDTNVEPSKEYTAGSVGKAVVGIAVSTGNAIIFHPRSK